VLALTLCAELPSYAWTWYSGASVGSNGTVYGWGVTDVTASPMYHVAYVSTTLTSPVKKRQAASGWVSAQNSVRADVSLAFESDDTGTYEDDSENEGYCYTSMGWFLDEWTEASATEPWPAYVGLSRSSADSITCSGSNFSAGRLRVWYQVLDATKSAIPIAGMRVSEQLSWSSSVCSTSDSCGQKPSPATWTTDATGTITLPDTIFNCSPTCTQGGSCAENWQQTFEVDGEGVGIVNSSTVGTLNCITTSCSTGPQGTTH
jgi:hypothetical protein